jgi:hypothetical protein
MLPSLATANEHIAEGAARQLENSRLAQGSEF